MTAARAFSKERNAALRSLDRSEFDHFMRKWNLPRPKQWIGDAWLAAMHKARLHIAEFSEAEKAVSRTWLAQHGFTERVDSKAACPACGNPGPSVSDCFICGVAL